MSVMYRDGIETRIDPGFGIRVSKTRDGHTVESFKVDGVRKCFVTLKDSPYCAHGNTVAEAVADALWKDPAKRPSLEELAETIREAGKKRKISLPEFRLLTGACAEGCRIAIKRAGVSGRPMTAFDIRDKVSKEWGDKLIRVLGWDKGGENNWRIPGRECVSGQIETTEEKERECRDMTKETKKAVKSAKAKTAAGELLGTPVIVRANVAGVHCGILESCDPANCAVTLKDAYRLWRVYTRDASGSVSDIAANGLKEPLGQHSIGARLGRVVIVNPQGLEIASATADAYASVASASAKG